jgi:hypothetical protein
MTKEEILDSLEIQSQGDYFRADVLTKMDEYAKQCIITVIKRVDIVYWQNISSKELMGERVTVEEILSRYEINKSLKP